MRKFAPPPTRFATVVQRMPAAGPDCGGASAVAQRRVTVGPPAPAYAPVASRVVQAMQARSMPKVRGGVSVAAAVDFHFYTGAVPPFPGSYTTVYLDALKNIVKPLWQEAKKQHGKGDNPQTVVFCSMAEKNTVISAAKKKIKEDIDNCVFTSGNKIIFDVGVNYEKVTYRPKNDTVSRFFESEFEVIFGYGNVQKGWGDYSIYHLY